MLLIAAVAALASGPHLTVQSRASVRIERPVAATRELWERQPPAKRREVVVRDEKGRPVLLRLIENE